MIQTSTIWSPGLITINTDSSIYIEGETDSHVPYMWSNSNNIHEMCHILVVDCCDDWLLLRVHKILYQ